MPTRMERRQERARRRRRGARAWLPELAAVLVRSVLVRTFVFSLTSVYAAQPPAGGKQNRNSDQIPEFKFHDAFFVLLFGPKAFLGSRRSSLRLIKKRLGKYRFGKEEIVPALFLVYGIAQQARRVIRHDHGHLAAGN